MIIEGTQILCKGRDVQLLLKDLGMTEDEFSNLVRSNERGWIVAEKMLNRICEMQDTLDDLYEITESAGILDD